jgi:hypothetical protein
VQEFLLRVELPLGLRLPGGGFISQEVKPEDKMATDSQNGDIITLSIMIGPWTQSMYLGRCYFWMCL